MKNILILSCTAGEGHNAAAKALLERIEKEGHQGRIVDFFGLASEKVSNQLNTSYVRMAKHTPHLFGFVYNFGVWISRHLHGGHSPVYWACSKVAPKLLELLQAEHFDAILSTHVFPVLATAYLERKGHSLPPSIAVATDYTCYPFWEETTCKYFVMAHDEMEEQYLKRKLPREKLRPCGIPVSLRFLDLPDKATARTKLQLDQMSKIHLIMGGSMGAGHMCSFTKKLYKEMGEDAELIVICGKNNALRGSLQKHFKDHPRAHILGFTTEIPLYMAACDVLYTKPGGLTSTEALVCKTPTVHTAPIPGCESFNFRFFGENGIALPAKNQREQIECGLRLAADEELRRSMREKQDACAKPNASLDIVRLAVDTGIDAEPIAK
ncbi:MAG: glycosyl transferase [Clostridia bacterium]|nr:glycosyl transferase [Clostridia bacterium]